MDFRCALAQSSHHGVLLGVPRFVSLLSRPPFGHKQVNARPRSICVLRSGLPKHAFRKMILDGHQRSDRRYAEISASSCIVRVAAMNPWEVRLTLQRIAACSSRRIVRNGLVAAPGPDPAPPATCLRASTEHAGHSVAASTAAIGGRLGGGQAQDDTLRGRRPCPEPIGDAPPRHNPRSTPRAPRRAEQCSCMGSSS
jgi:hypothetical protein